VSPVERLLTKLPDARRNGRGGWSTTCPAHDDRRPSLSISQGDDGRALVHCHAGCTPEEIVAALGMKLADLMPEAPTTARPMPKATRKPTAKAPAPRTPATFATAREAVAVLEHELGPRAAAWTYHDADDKPVGLVVRWDTPAGKTIRPVSRTPSGWIIGAMSEPRPLYRLPDLLMRTGEPVYVVEGEKCADIMLKLGLLATTSSGGANAARKSDWGPLSGRNVMILPDNDQAGQSYASTVAGILANLSPAATVRIVRLADAWPDLPDGGDIADLVERGEDHEMIKRRLTILADAAPVVTPTPRGPVLTCLADVEPREIKWLWPGRIALGKLTLLVGDPGLGKSFISLDVAARVSRGIVWPDDAKACPPGGVVLLTAEDDLSDTVRPRLDAAGADASRIIALQAVKDASCERPFDLACDLVALKIAIESVENCRLVVIDPLAAYLGDVDSHRNAEVRGMLAGVAAVAARYNVAILAVTHLNKSNAVPAIYRTTGSIAFTAAARTAWCTCRDKNDPTGRRRLLLPLKNNVAGDETGLAYRLLQQNGGVVVSWELQPVSIPLDEALAQPQQRGPEPVERNEAAKWLGDLLADGPVAVDELRTLARDAGIAWTTVRRAKAALGVAAERDGFGPGGGWRWRLPTIGAQVSPHTENLSAYGKPERLWADGVKNGVSGVAVEAGAPIGAQVSDVSAYGPEWGEL